MTVNKFSILPKSPHFPLRGLRLVNLKRGRECFVSLSILIINPFLNTYDIHTVCQFLNCKSVLFTGKNDHSIILYVKQTIFQYWAIKKKDFAYATPATTICHLCKTNKTVTYHVNAKVNFKLHFDSDGTSIFHILACYRRPNRIVVQSLVTDMRFSSFFLHHILQSIGQYHG